MDRGGCCYIPAGVFFVVSARRIDALPGRYCFYLEQWGHTFLKVCWGWM